MVTAPFPVLPHASSAVPGTAYRRHRPISGTGLHFRGSVPGELAAGTPSGLAHWQHRRHGSTRQIVVAGCEYTSSLPSDPHAALSTLPVTIFDTL